MVTRDWGSHLENVRRVARRDGELREPSVVRDARHIAIARQVSGVAKWRYEPAGTGAMTTRWEAAEIPSGK